MKQPLEDVRILDLSRVLAAPLGTMILADLGADVIRVESPNGTDSMREWGPFFNGESTYYFTSNRNKRSMTLDLKQKEGKELFLRLVEKADVVVENFKTGTLEKLGLDYDTLKTVNPKIILCSVTGYGQTGSYKDEPGFDPVIQAISGLIDVTGPENGEGVKVGIPIADIFTAHYVSIGILTALRKRDLTNEGNHIDLSLLDVQMSSMANIASAYLNANMISKRLGNAHNNVVPYQVFETKDSPIMICAGNNRLYKSLCEVIGRPELASDPKFLTNDKRLENRDELVQIIQGILKTASADDWLVLLSKAKVPAGKVSTIQESFRHPQVLDRDMVETITHPEVGDIKMVKNPLRFSNLNVESKLAPPLLGEHTEQILQTDLNISKEQIKELRANRIIL